MKALVGAFNQEKALVGAFSVIVQPIVEPMDRFTALVMSVSPVLILLLRVSAPTHIFAESGLVAAARVAPAGTQPATSCQPPRSAVTQ